MQSHKPRILCAFTSDDLADAVVATARRIGRDGGYELHFLHASDLPGRTLDLYSGGAPAVPAYSRDLTERRLAKAGEALLERLGLDSTTAEVVPGDPVTEIRAKAEEIDPDLVILGSRGHGPLTGALIGSVTRVLANDGRWPLLIVADPEAGAAGGPVVCGVASPLEDAVLIARTAAEFARRLGKPLVLAHVPDDGGSDYVVDAGGFPAAPGGILPTTSSRATQDAAPASRLAEVAERLEGSGDVRTEILDGSPGEALAGLAHHEDAEIIVVGRRRRAALRSAIEGSVSLDVIRNSGCLVMVVPGAAPVSDDHGGGHS